VEEALLPGSPSSPRAFEGGLATHAVRLLNERVLLPPARAAGQAPSAAYAPGIATSWMAWVAVLFVLFNCGAPHAVSRTLDEKLSRGALRLTSANAVDAVRAYLTNDGDIERYFAYCEATLGKPHLSRFVRPFAAWQSAFSSGVAEAEPGRAYVPGGPLRPYRDFLVEYPPGFFLWAMPPALGARSLDGYRLAFCTAMALVLTAALLLNLRIAPALGADLRGRTAAYAALAVFLVGTVTTHRYDAVVALSLAAAAWATFRGRPVALGLAVGIGAASKLVPLVAAPAWALYLVRRRRWSELAVAAAVAAVTAAVLGLAPLAWGGTLGETVAYHRLRPLQLESTLAAALGLWRAFGGPPVQYVQTFGSSNLAGAAADAALRATAPLTLVGLALAWAWTWIRVVRAPTAAEAQLAALQGAAAALVSLMVLGKVLSPQYLVWVLPLGALLCAARGGASPWIFLGALALTQIVYPATYSALQELRPWACGLVLSRNALLVGWIVHLGTRPPSAAAAHA
jgi:hypothetical protein